VELTVIGAGAIGGTLGAYMARAGAAVRLVDADAAHVAAMRHDGLTLQAYDERFTVPVRALAPAELRGPLDVVLLAVKAQHTRDALAAVAPHLQPDSVVVSLQNGLCERLIASAVGAERTVGALVNFSADYLEPGVIHYGGPGTVRLGALDGSRGPRLEAIAATLSARGPVEVTGNIWGFKWTKMAYASMLFASALTDETMADVIDRHRAVVTELAAEALDVARAESVRPERFDDIEPDAYHSREGRDPARLDASLDRLVARRRRDKKTHSGIWRDLAVRRRRTEVDEQIGLVAEIGRGHGLGMRLTDRVVRMVHELEDGRRERGLDNLAELESLMGVQARVA
jgi:2-dehydropantoate 2-reductase